MADVIENRVVELGFDNRNFERNARTSIATLGKLDEAMQFKGVASGFRSIQNGLRYIDFSSVTNSLYSVRDAFTNIGAAIKVNFFDMLGNQVIRLGQSLISNTIGQIQSGGFARALNIEQAQFKVKGLGADWKSVYDDMDYAVSGTAYGIDEAANAAAQFLASNVNVGDDMKAALRGISGLAAMTSSSYGDIADVFIAAAGKGRVQAMEMQRISMRGVNAYGELAKQMGKTEDEVRELVSKGQVDFQTFANAMDNAFGEHAKEANETYEGSLSNVRAALSRIGEIWYEPWIHGLIPIFNQLRVSIDVFKNALKADIDGDSVYQQLTDLMDAGSKFVVQIIRVFTPALNSLKKVMEPIIDTMGALEEKIRFITDILEAFNESRKEDDETAKNTEETKKQTKEIKASAKALERYAKIAKFSAVNLAEFRDTYKKTVGENIRITGVLGDTMVALDKNVGLSVANIIDEYNALYDSQKSVLQSSVNLFSEWGHSYDITFKQLKKNLLSNKDGLETLMEDMATIVQNGASEEFVEHLKGMGTQGADIIHALAGATKEDLKDYMSEWESTNNMFDTITKEWTKGAKDTAEQTIQALTGVPEATIEDASRMYNGMYQQMGMEQASSYAQGFSSIYGDVQAEYANLVKSEEDATGDESLISSVNSETSKLNKTKEEGIALDEQAAEKLKAVKEAMWNISFPKIEKALDSFNKVLSGTTVIFANLKDIFKIIVESFDAVFDGDYLKELEEFSEEVYDIFQSFKLTGTQTELLSRIFKGFFNAVDYGIAILRECFDSIAPFLKSLSNSGNLLLDIAAKFGDFFTNLNSARKEAKAFSPLIQSLINMFKSGIEIIYYLFKKVVHILHIAADAFGEVWKEFSPENTTFPDLLKSISDIIKNFKISGERAELLKKIFKGLFSVVHVGYTIFKSFKEFTEDIFTKLFGSFGKNEPVILRVLAALGDWVHGLSIAIKEAAESGGLFGVIGVIFSKIKASIKAFVEGKERKNFDGFFETLKDRIKTGVEKAVDWFKRNKPISKIMEFFGDIDFSGFFIKVFDNIHRFFAWLGAMLEDENSILGKFVRTFIDIFDAVATVLKNQVPNIDIFLTDMFAFFHRMFVTNPELGDKAGELLITLGNTLITMFQAISDIIIALKDPLVEVAKALTEIIKSLSDVINGWMQYSARDPEGAFGMVAFILIIYIIKQFMNFFKTTTLVTFEYALKRIYTAISNFFGNLSGLAYRAGQLMFAKEVSTIATAIIKIAIALAIIAAVIGYQSEHYSGARAGLGMMIFFIIAIVGFTKIVASVKDILSAGLGQLFVVSFLLGKIGTAFLIMGIGLAVVIAAMSFATTGEIVAALIASVIMFVALYLVLNNVFFWLDKLGTSAGAGAMKINAISGLLIAFAAATLILSIAFKTLLSGMKQLYYATGKDATQTIVMVVAVGSMITLMMMGLVAILGALNTLTSVNPLPFVAFLVLVGVLVTVIEIMSDITVKFAKSKVNFDHFGATLVTIIFAAGIMLIAGQALLTLTAFGNTVMSENVAGTILAFALFAVLIYMMMKVIEDLADIAVLTKAISFDEIGKLFSIVGAMGLLFILAAGAFAGIYLLSDKIALNGNMVGMAAIVVVIFELLGAMVVKLAEVALMAKTFSIGEVDKLVNISYVAISLFLVAALLVVAIQKLKSMDLIKGGSISMLLTLGAVMLMFNTLISVVKAIAKVAVELKKNGVTNKEIKGVLDIFGSVALVFTLLTALMVGVGSVAGIGGTTLVAGIVSVGLALIFVTASIYLICKAVALLGETIIAFAKVWPDIRDNMRLMIEDLNWVIPEAIDAVCNGIIKGIPSILIALFVVFVAINAFLALIAPVQAAMFMLSLNAMLDVILLGADIILAKLLLLLDIVLIELDAQAEIIGYELTSILLKAVWGAVKAIGNFLMYAGEGTAEGFYNSMMGTWQDRFSESNIIDLATTIGARLVAVFSNLSVLITDGLDAYADAVYDDLEGIADQSPWEIMEDNVKAWTDPFGGMSEIKQKAKDDYDAAMDAWDEGVDEASGKREPKLELQTNPDDYLKNVDFSDNEVMNRMKEKGLVTQETADMVDKAKDKIQNAMNGSFDEMNESGSLAGNSWTSGLMNTFSNFGIGDYSELYTKLFGEGGIGGIFNSENLMNNFSLSGENGGENFMSGITSGMQSKMREFTNSFSMDSTNLNTEDMLNSLNMMDLYGNGDVELGFNTDALTPTLQGAFANIDSSGISTDVNVNSIDPQMQSLIDRLVEVNQQVAILNEKIESSVILTKDSSINITAEMDGAVVAQKTYPTTAIMNAENENMRSDGLALRYTKETGVIR